MFLKNTQQELDFMETQPRFIRVELDQKEVPEATLIPVERIEEALVSSEQNCAPSHPDTDETKQTAHVLPANTLIPWPVKLDKTLVEFDEKTWKLDDRSYYERGRNFTAHVNPRCDSYYICNSDDNFRVGFALASEPTKPVFFVQQERDISGHRQDDGISVKRLSDSWLLVVDTPNIGFASSFTRLCRLFRPDGTLSKYYGKDWSGRLGVTCFNQWDETGQPIPCW